MSRLGWILVAFVGALLLMDYAIVGYGWARRRIRFWSVKLYAYYVIWQVRRKLKALGITLLPLDVSSRATRTGEQPK